MNADRAFRQAAGWDFPEPDPTHYRCRKCGEVFESPEAVIETWRELHEHWGQVSFETKEVPHCPHCDADDLEDSTGPDDEYSPDLDLPEEIP